jgi:hypothetical protein
MTPAQEPGGQGSNSLSPPNSKALIGALSVRYWAHIKKRILSRDAGTPGGLRRERSHEPTKANIWREYG